MQLKHILEKQLGQLGKIGVQGQMTSMGIYESARIYKDKTKTFDKKAMREMAFTNTF